MRVVRSRAILPARWKNMTKRTLAMLISGALALGTATPSFADGDGPVHNMVGLGGVTTGLLIDVPEGIVVDSLYRVPMKCQRTLAEHFGDSKGAGQNIAGALLGFPVGFVWGIPYGALHGAKHAFSKGWEKPFSTESYLVTEEK
jgi:hypothetical protein